VVPICRRVFLLELSLSTYLGLINQLQFRVEVEKVLCTDAGRFDAPRNVCD